MIRVGLQIQMDIYIKKELVYKALFNYNRKNVKNDLYYKKYKSFFIIKEAIMKNYGTDPKLDELVDSGNLEARVKAAEQGYGLDKLINDKNFGIHAKRVLQNL